MAKMTINGVTYEGSNIKVLNNVVYVDGVKIEAHGDAKGEIKVVVLEGVINELKTDGSVNCGNVTGSVAAGGSVNCDGVGGNVAAGGSVNCDDVRGNVSAGGSIVADNVGGVR